jgi:hypothetical protein
MPLVGSGNLSNRPLLSKMLESVSIASCKSLSTVRSQQWSNRDISEIVYSSKTYIAINYFSILSSLSSMRSMSVTKIATSSKLPIE